jgi:hypothetical protein
MCPVKQPDKQSVNQNFKFFLEIKVQIHGEIREIYRKSTCILDSAHMSNNPAIDTIWAQNS